MSTAGQAVGLTTTRAPFIEDARRHGEIYIHQPYELYSAQNQDTWSRLLLRMRDRWARYANHRYLEGLDRLHLAPDRIPRLEDINQFMQPLTGFRARAVSGYVPAYVFFDCLRRREFPTTVTIRDGEQLEYLPEPDIFHDVAGHVPMHTDPAFAEALVRFGATAAAAARRAAETTDDHARTELGSAERSPSGGTGTLPESPRMDDRLRRLTSNIRAMSRFFWFSVEFGLMRAPRGGALKAYGSGLLSSFGEIAHAIDAPDTQRCPFQIERVINQVFEIDRYQPLLFVVDSFDHLYALVSELERWMEDGRLDAVAPGPPEVSETDLKSFLGAVG